ncbi:F0F1 ATP synthase subunit B [Gardnerella vaginalis]|uniref:ATP synthase subunit b n=1 Tax=Gardnerella vaginalis TaxID=2702 RepID=A0A2K1SVA4_GARVA|nr:F0F1 ATP synthase subunit B [Gardnerella vaginalis]PNS43461.1 F0F1 ATP synthase subunit B [Gardnerella vaginalis]
MAFAAGDSKLALFLPEAYDLVWSLIILVILAVFFYKFVMPKFQAIFDERAEKIEGGIAKAAETQREADELKERIESQVAQAQADAAKTREQARAQASKIIDEARQRAEHDAAKIISEAQSSIEAQHKHAMNSLQGEVSVLAAALAGKILASKLDDEKVSAQILDHVIDDVENSENSDHEE